MSYSELTRRELQALCKERGLPANRSNAAMASSLASYYWGQQSITQACAKVGKVRKSVKARVVAKPERLETSLASLILGSTKPPAQEALLKKSKEPGARSASLVSSPAHNAFLPKTTPLRRRKASDAVGRLPTCAEDATLRNLALDSTENLRVLPERTSVHPSRTVVERSSTPEEPQLAPHPSSSILVTDDQDPPRTRKLEHQEDMAPRTSVRIVVKVEALLRSPSRSESVASSSAHNQDCRDMSNPGRSQPVLMSPLLRITTNVDKLIRRATGMLEKFQQWKIDHPN